MRSFIVAGRVARQILKDRRTMALMFVAPLLVLFLLYTVLNTPVMKPRITTVSLPAEWTTVLSQEAETTPASDLNAALQTLKARNTDAVAVYAEPNLTVYVEGTEASVTMSVQKAVASATATYTRKQTVEDVRAQVQALLAHASGAQGASAASAGELTLPQVGVSFTYLNGSADTSAFDGISPLLMGFFIFFFVFLLAGVAFLRERTTGTLERLLATPVKRCEIVLGYFLGFGVFVCLQTLMVQAYMVGLLKVTLKGDFALVMLINLLLAAGSLSLGTLLSAFARNELQMFQFIPIVIVPQVLFCGLFNLRGAPAWVSWLSAAFPLTYASNALNDVALRGLGFSSIWPDLLVLLGYVVVFLVLNTLALKKYRRI